MWSTQSEKEGYIRTGDYIQVMTFYHKKVLPIVSQITQPNLVECLLEPVLGEVEADCGLTAHVPVQVQEGQRKL